MQLSWISDGLTKIVAIVGICKNAGKTTVLNAVLRQHGFLWGVLSTGRDGESEDTIYKTPKPRVFIPAGSFFCCDTPSLVDHGSKVELLAKQQSSNRELWLVKAVTGLETEITGPNNAQAQMACAQKLMALGAQKIIIDGSLDRKSIVLNKGVDGIILVAGASFGPLGAIVNEIQRLMLLSGIEVYPYLCDETILLTENREIHFYKQGLWQSSGLGSLIGHENELVELLNSPPEAIYIPGAYSSSIHHRLGAHLSSSKLIFRNPECIKLDSDELQVFLANHRVYCRIPLVIKAIAVNAHGVGAADIAADLLLADLRHRFTGLPVLDLMALEGA